MAAPEQVHTCDHGTKRHLYIVHLAWDSLSKVHGLNCFRSDKKHAKSFWNNSLIILLKNTFKRPWVADCSWHLRAVVSMMLYSEHCSASCATLTLKQEQYLVSSIASSYLNMLLSVSQWRYDMSMLCVSSSGIRRIHDNIFCIWQIRMMMKCCTFSILWNLWRPVSTYSHVNTRITIV